MCVLITQVASIQVDVPHVSYHPRVAILFVGRSLHARLSAKHSSANIFDLMTGEEGAYAGRQMFKSSSDPSASDSNVTPGWENAVEMLIEPVKKTHTVDVFICIDHAMGQVPAEVSQVFEVPAMNQEERGVKCVSKLKDNGRTYDWLIKARSDFVFYKQFPVMTSFQPGYVYTRFRAIAGITGLTSDHISYLPCSQKCADAPPGHIGYLNDDMVRVVPGDLTDFAFVDSTSHSNTTSGGERLSQIPQNWIDIDSPIEGRITRFWLQRGILTKPLACPGYPRHDHYSHHARSLKCALEPVDLVNCPPNMPLEDVHQALWIENQRFE
jgi:hypothetical protein